MTGLALASFLLGACSSDIEPTVFANSEAAISSLDVDQQTSELDNNLVSADAKGAFLSTANELSLELEGVFNGLTEKNDSSGDAELIIRDLVLDGDPARIKSRNRTTEDGSQILGFTVEYRLDSEGDKFGESGFSIVTQSDGTQRAILYDKKWSLDDEDGKFLRHHTRTTISADQYAKVSLLYTNGEADTEPIDSKLVFDMNDFDGHSIGSDHFKEETIDDRAEAMTESLNNMKRYVKKATELTSNP